MIQRPRHVLDPTGCCEIGDGCSIVASADLDTTADLTIGSRCVFSQDCIVLTHDHRLDDYWSVYGVPKSIGHDVLIGARAIVLASCTRIGDGSVIGAGAVVTHDVPPGEVWAGNPARKVRDK